MAELKKPNPSEICPPGYHVVRGHERICHSGTKTWVDAHIRKNRGKIRPGLLIENIHYLFWNSKKKYPVLNSISGFGDKGSEYDTAIQFWIDYWKSQGLKYPEDLDPLMIKALIAEESSFRVNPPLPKGSSAEGLMQVTDQAVRVLGGFPNKDGYIECKNNLLHVTKEEKIDPMVNIALGTRLLAHKYSQIPKNRSKDARTMIEGYYSFGPGGKAYAERILSRYEKSRKKK